jgi:hypothetical protein
MLALTHTGHISIQYWGVRNLRRQEGFRLHKKLIQTTEVPAMTYRVYSGPRGAKAISPLERDHQLYKEFNLLDEAMSWARHVNKRGRVALLIEGDDGTRLTKLEIASALKSPDAEVPAEDAA